MQTSIVFVFYFFTTFRAAISWNGLSISNLLQCLWVREKHYKKLIVRLSHIFVMFWFLSMAEKYQWEHWQHYLWTNIHRRTSTAILKHRSKIFQLSIVRMNYKECEEHLHNVFLKYLYTLLVTHDRQYGPGINQKSVKGHYRKTNMQK